jgi:hypothetical protein
MSGADFPFFRCHDKRMNEFKDKPQFTAEEEEY